MKIAVIGSGIAGIVSSYLLSQEHEVHLYEKNDYLGGHTNTRIVSDHKGKEIAVDTGFIVCNPKNYPNFFKIMRQLAVPLQKSEMSFSFCDAKTSFSYLGPTISEFCRKPESLLSSRFIRLVYEQRKFNRDMRRDFFRGALKNESLADYLRSKRVSNFLVESYVTPLIASIWSSTEIDTESFPAETFVTFFENHSMLDFRDRPQWYTVHNGSHSYIHAFRQHFRGKIYLNQPVREITRSDEGISIVTKEGVVDFDRVIFATHADQALRLLQSPTVEEKSLLGVWRYSKNLAILHSDAQVSPLPRRHWASWNYLRDSRATGDSISGESVSITYYMNRLQAIDSTTDFFVTLNPRRAINPQSILYEIEYEHPVYTPEGIRTQVELQKIQGKNRTYYCGAYLGYGFHEDGVRAALEVTKHFGIGA